jgi:hypothetical protein
MERKNTKQIEKICKNANNDDISFLNQLPKEIIINHINPELKKLSPEIIKNLRLVSKNCAQEFAKDPLTWSLMPDNVEKAYDLLPAPDKNVRFSHKFCQPLNKFYKSELILAVVAEQNDYEAVKWIINNIKPIILGTIFRGKINPVLFAKENKNIKMGKILIKTEMKICGHSEEQIVENWKLYYDNPSTLECMQGLLPLNQHNSFFAFYCLAAQFDDVNRLKKLCLQTQPTNQEIYFLLGQCQHNAPNCFMYLFDQYKNDGLSPLWCDTYSKNECSETINNCLNKKQPSSCTIL